MEKTLQRVRAHRALKDEIDAESAYRKALLGEEAFKRSNELPKMADAFATIAKRFSQTFHGQRAALDVRRISQNYQTLRRSTAKASGIEINFPKVPGDPDRLRQRFAAFSRKLREP